MAKSFITSLSTSLLKIEELIVSAILRKLRPGFCITNVYEEEVFKTSIKDNLSSGFLWAVPKKRRPVEKRWCRKFGLPKYNWKPYVAKTNLVMCRKCGHFHESCTICGHCYTKIKEETEEIQKAMVNEFKLDPIKEDIVVLYEGEKDSQSKEFWKGQRIIEMPKKRPIWFQNNLLEPTAQQLSTSAEVATKNLA